MLVVLACEFILVVTHEIGGVFWWLDDTVWAFDTDQTVDGRFHLMNNSIVYKL